MPKPVKNMSFMRIEVGQMRYYFPWAGDAAQLTFQLLDIKHMQLDSLGWLHCAHLSSTGLVSLASHHCEATLKFFTANYKDSLDHLTFSYKYGSFLKISEFVEFRDRLHNSHHYTRCSIERMLSELLMSSTHEQAVEAIGRMDATLSEHNIEWDKLRDNRDLDVVKSFDPKNKLLSPEQIEQTFNREVELIKLRRLQLRCLAAAFDLLKSPSSETANGTSDDLLPKLISELSVMNLPTCPAQTTELNYPMKSRTDLIHSSRHLPAFVRALQLAYQLSDLRRDSQSSDSDALSTMTKVAEEITEICNEAEESLNNDHSLLTRRRALENTTNSFETLSFLALLCGVYKNLVQPAAASGKKGKKKKDVPDQPQPKLVEGLSTLAKHLQDSCNRLLETLGHWELNTLSEHLCKWSLDDSRENLEHNLVADGQKRRDEMVVAVVTKMRHSYMISAKELQNLLSHKCKQFAIYTS